MTYTTVVEITFAGTERADRLNTYFRKWWPRQDHEEGSLVDVRALADGRDGAVIRINFNWESDSEESREALQSAVEDVLNGDNGFAFEEVSVVRVAEL